MAFFKIIKDGEIVSVGSVFLKWNINRHKMYICNIDEGQFIQSFDEANIYKAPWMKSAPSEAKGYQLAEVVAIGETEYNDLLELLSEGEEVPVPIEEPVYDVPQPEPPEEEQPLTIAQMRVIIKQQQEQIARLMKKAKLT